VKLRRLPTAFWVGWNVGAIIGFVVGAIVALLSR
jgi:gas vesicle protein